MGAREEGFDPFARFSDAFRLAGKIRLEACPVCGCAEIAELWRLPQNRLRTKAHLDAPGTRLDRLYLDYLPTLRTPQEVFRFDICGRCQSVFLNPKFDAQASYARDESKVQSFRALGLTEFRNAAASFVNMFPSPTRTVVDAACGAGQMLAAIRERDPGLRLVGLELSRPSVDFMRSELGLEAHLVDLDHDDFDTRVAPGTVDFAILQEAFEHVGAPMTVMRKMVRLLRVGGRLHFTAQYYGDNDLQIRPGEPIYINDVGFNWMIDELDVDLVDLKCDIKLRATVEKRAEGGKIANAAGARSGFPAVSLPTPPPPRRSWPQRLRAVLRRRLGLARRRTSR